MKKERENVIINEEELLKAYEKIFRTTSED